MLVAVPAETSEGLGATRSGHFGHAAWFTLVTIEDGQVTKVESLENVDHDEVGCGGVIDHVISQNIDAIIVIGMGMPPFTRFSNAGVAVYRDQTQPYVGGAITLLLRDQLDRMNPGDACVH